jgi:hypothetical protein
VQFLTNSSWTQACQCCLPEAQVRQTLIAPVTCTGFNPLKENCSCTNATLSNTTNATNLTCNCIHSISNTFAQGLSFPSQGQCDCGDYLLGTKSCRCCIPYDVQVQQMTPTCASNQILEAAMCSSLGNRTTNLTCSSSSKRNNLGSLTFQNVLTNASSCYCHPGTSLVKACNCCLSETQYTQTKPTCADSRISTACQCSPNVANGTLACSCANTYFNTTPTVLTAQASNCACASPVANQTTVACQCCATQREIVPLPTCSAQQSFANCNKCAYNATSKNVTCSCTGGHALNQNNAVSLNSVATPLSQCACVNGQNGTTCSCCVSNSLWLTATPTCDLSQTTSEKCACRNVSSTAVVLEQLWSMMNVTSNVTCQVTGYNGELCQATPLTNTTRVWNNAFACYAKAVCGYNYTANTCGW